MIYKIYNPDTGHGFDPVNTADPAAWITERGLEGYTWEESTYVEPPAPAPDPAAKLAADMDFGSSLIREFLLDNRNDPNVKTSDSLALLVKFGPAENLLRLGDIRKCRALIDSFTTDTIFTPARKAKYLSMIDTYLTA